MKVDVATYVGGSPYSFHQEFLICDIDINGCPVNENMLLKFDLPPFAI